MPGNDTIHHANVQQTTATARGRHPIGKSAANGRRSPAAPRAAKQPARPAKLKAPLASKSDQARSIFDRMSGQGKSRKEVIESFVDDAKLTPSGASTYYQKFLTESKTGGRALKNGTSTASRRGRPTDESSKAGMARAIFKRMAKSPRKDVLEAFVSQAGLTPAGASTYYQTQRRNVA
jgi:hypothetical protein